MAIFLLALLTIPLIVLSSIWRGYVLTVLWGWFIVPVFHLPALTIVVAIGVAMVVGFLTYQQPEEKPNDTRSSTEKISAGIATALMHPAVYLLIGWIIQLFL